jgi:hypothetical protein
MAEAFGEGLSAGAENQFRSAIFFPAQISESLDKH